jgi:tetraacyldisaccharide 4'-kinase
MSGAQRWLERAWYGREPLAVLLIPLSWLFGAIVALRRLAYRLGVFRSHRIGRPVIVVGNLTVGGSGKTPLTVHLVRRLQAHGLRVGVVSRGYGGTAEAPLRVDAATSPDLAGDEPVLIAARTGAPVVVARDRVAAAALLAPDVDVVVADDGLQHYRLARDLELVVVDGRRGFGNGRLLPAGPLREPTSRAGRAGAIVFNGGAGEGGSGRPTGVSDPPRVTMRLEPTDVVALGDGARAPLAGWAGRRVHAVAGIGDPERFFASLAAAGLDVVRHPFPDHASYSRGDLEFGDDLPVLMTEKDAVKCRAFAAPRHHYLEVTAAFGAADADRLDALALRAAGALERRDA